jgi:hypothetical protein
MSITLTNGKLIQVNGVTVENDSVGATTVLSVDFFASTVSYTLRTGSLIPGPPQNLNAGAFGDTVTVTINLISGAWTSSNGLNGTIAAGQLTQIQNQFKGDRNLSEQHAVNQSIMPGTQVPW